MMSHQGRSPDNLLFWEPLQSCKKKKRKVVQLTRHVFRAVWSHMGSLFYFETVLLVTGAAKPHSLTACYLNPQIAVREWSGAWCCSLFWALG